MKFNLAIVLVTCLSYSLTPVESTAILKAKVAAGVKGALLGGGVLAAKKKLLKGIVSHLSGKGSSVLNAVSAVSDVVQNSITDFLDQPIPNEDESDQTQIPPVVAGFEVPFTLESQPIKLYAIGLRPTGVKSLEEQPLKTQTTETRTAASRLSRLLKNKLGGLFNKLHGAMTKKTMGIKGLVRAMTGHTNVRLPVTYDTYAYTF